MSTHLPNTPANEMLAAVVTRRIHSDALSVAAMAGLYRLLGIGAVCLMIGGGIGLAFWGYSAITNSTTTMERLSIMMANALEKVTLKVNDVGVTGTVALDTTNAAPVKLDTSSGMVRPTVQQLTGGPAATVNANVVTDFSVFKYIRLGNDTGNITTGWDFKSSTDTVPFAQRCYYAGPTVNGSRVDYTLARDGRPLSPPQGLPINFQEALSKCMWFGG